MNNANMNGYTQPQNAQPQNYAQQGGQYMPQPQPQSVQAPAPAQNYAIANFNADDAAEELEGLGSISLDVIKIPAGGGIMFEIPSGDPENPDVAKEIEGVIVWHHPVNTYWSKEFTGEDAMPDCVSLDGKVGKDMHSERMINCSTCQLNQFGSKGAGKACRNSHRLYILRQGDALPLILSVPPSSLKTLKEYIAKRIIARNKRTACVITKIALKKAQSSGGITYSQAVFSYVRDLTPEEIASAAPMTSLVKSIGLRYPEPEDQSDLNGQAVPGSQSYGAPQGNGYAQPQPQSVNGYTSGNVINAQQPQPQPQSVPSDEPQFVDAQPVNGDLPF